MHKTISVVQQYQCQTQASVSYRIINVTQKHQCHKDVPTSQKNVLMQKHGCHTKTSVSYGIMNVTARYHCHTEHPNIPRAYSIQSIVEYQFQTKASMSNRRISLIHKHVCRTQSYDVTRSIIFRSCKASSRCIPTYVQDLKDTVEGGQNIENPREGVRKAGEGLE